MEVKKKIAPCSCCGRNCELNYGVENFEINELNLKNYLAYKDIYAFKCSKCGLISTDISAAGEHNLFESVKNTDEFNDAMNYTYLEGLNNELYENHSEGVPVNIYDAYSVMLQNSNDREKYLRVLNHTIELKTMMIDKYRYDLEEDYDEQDAEIFEELEELVYDNIEDSRNLFIDEVARLEDCNIFLLLMAIENFAGLDKYKEAKKQFLILKEELKNIKLSKDLTDYFDNLVERG